MGKLRGKTVINFTKERIESLPLPPKGKDVYYDAQQRHLCLMVSYGGQRSYYVRRTVDGKPMRMSIGRYEDLSIKEAREKASTVSTQLGAGKRIDEIRENKKDEPTLLELWHHYLEVYGKPHKRSWQYDQANFNLCVADEPIAKMRLSKIRISDAQSLHAALGANRGHITANRVLELLRAVFNKAIKWKMTTATNPFTDIEKFKEVSRARFLQADELPKFFEALSSCGNRDLHDYVIISLFTGARKTNVLSMQWSHLDLVDAIWHIPDTKNGEPLSIPLINDIKELLLARRSRVEGDYVFPTPVEGSSTPYYTNPKRAWISLLKEAGMIDKRGKWLVPKLTMHDLRRSCGSWQTIAGTNQFVVGASLGHKDPKSTQIYSRLNLDAVRSSLDKAADIIKTKSIKQL